MIGIVILILVIISVVLAIRSLKQLEKMEHVDTVKNELKKGKVVFQEDSSTVSSLSSEKSRSSRFE